MGNFAGYPSAVISGTPGKSGRIQGLGEVVAPFVPTDIANILAWYDADDANTIIESSNLVSQWNDKSLNGNNVTQPSGGLRPLTNSLTIGGLNAISFTADFLTKDPLVLSNNLTIFIVGNVSATANIFASLLSVDAANDFQIDAAVVGEFRGKFLSTNLGNPTVEDVNFINTDFVLSYRLSNNDSNLEMRRNAVAIDAKTYNGNLSANQDFKIGVNRGVNQFTTCKIGEIIFYNRDLSAAEITQVENYLLSRWSI